MNVVLWYFTSCQLLFMQMADTYKKKNKSQNNPFWIWFSFCPNLEIITLFCSIGTWQLINVGYIQSWLQIITPLNKLYQTLLIHPTLYCHGNQMSYMFVKSKSDWFKVLCSITRLMKGAMSLAIDTYHHDGSPVYSYPFRFYVFHVKCFVRVEWIGRVMFW